MSIPNPFPSSSVAAHVETCFFLLELLLPRWTFDFGSSGFPFLRDELFLFPHLINSIIILTTSSSLIWNISIYYISQIIYYIAIVFIFVFIFISHLWGGGVSLGHLLFPKVAFETLKGPILGCSFGVMQQSRHLDTTP